MGACFTKAAAKKWIFLFVLFSKNNPFLFTFCHAEFSMRTFDWKIEQGAVQLVQIKGTGNSWDKIWKQLNQCITWVCFLCNFSSLKSPGNLRGSLPQVHVFGLGTVHKQQIQNQTKYWGWWNGWCELLTHRICSRKCSWGLIPPYSTTCITPVDFSI